MELDPPATVPKRKDRNQRNECHRDVNPNGFADAGACLPVIASERTDQQRHKRQETNPIEPIFPQRMRHLTQRV